MRKLSILIVFVASLAVVPPLMAQKQLVGQVGPEFEAGDMLYGDTVQAKSLKDCEGDVVLIKYWGLRCPPCKASMPGIQRLWSENRDQGFHIFHVERQGHTPEEIEAYCEKQGYSFPQTLRTGSNFSGYPGGNGLPYAFLIGVDGKVVWQGRHGYEAKIAEELAKVRYPGLGKAEVAPALDKAARLFSARRYAKAISEAEKRLEKTDDDPAVAADARYIIERAHQRGARLMKRAEAAREAHEFSRALSFYTELAKTFEGATLGEEAQTKIDRFRRDPDIKKELRADQALENFLGRVKRAPTRAKQQEMLEAFAEKFEGTRAAERARRRAKLL